MIPYREDDWLPCLRCGVETLGPAYCDTCLPLHTARVDAAIRDAKRAVDAMRASCGMDDYMGEDDFARRDREVEHDEHERIGC